MPGFAVRGIEIGGGTPRIAVPVAVREEDELIRRARALRDEPFDILEWRADAFAYLQPSFVRSTLAELRTLLPEKLLLFTLRTKEEGGEYLLPFTEYAELTAEAAESGYADLIDLELQFGEALRPLIARIHAAGGRAVLSSHDFSRTPPREELRHRFFAMQALGADIAKLAVMPGNPADVLSLLSVSEELREGLGCPFIAISMGRLGALSRVATTFGSAVTFGSAGEESAPGQLPVRVLADILHALSS